MKVDKESLEDITDKLLGYLARAKYIIKRQMHIHLRTKTFCLIRQMMLLSKILVLVEWLHHGCYHFVAGTLEAGGRNTSISI